MRWPPLYLHHGGLYAGDSNKVENTKRNPSNCSFPKCWQTLFSELLTIITFRPVSIIFRNGSNYDCLKCWQLKFSRRLETVIIRNARKYDSPKEKLIYFSEISAIINLPTARKYNPRNVINYTSKTKKKILVPTTTTTIIMMIIPGTGKKNVCDS